MWKVDAGQKHDPPTLNLIRAIQYYTDKYGKVPNRCEVHKTELGQLHAPSGMTLTGSKAVKRGHLMLASDPSVDERLPMRTE